MQLVLAVDLGTGGPKVGLVSLGGALHAFEHRRVETRVLPDGGAEQDADEWWRLISDAARDVIADVDSASVRAVAVTGQWASRVAVDEHGAPVAPVVMWMDTRGRRHSRALIGGRVAGFAPRKAAVWIRRSGGVPSPSGADPLSHVLHLERDRPEVAARWFLEPVDYLTMRFTGVASATPASMLATWLTDNRRIDGEPEYDEALVRMAGIDASKLPPLRKTGTVVGPVLAAVADVIGLGRDVPVITGIPDLHGATVGSGAVGLYEPHLSISTTGWISCPLPKKKTDALHSMASVPGLGDGRYLLANSIDTSGVCLEWASGLFGGSIEELLSEAASSPPGAGGLVFTPWLGGTRSPVEDRFARAAWQNASGSAVRGDFARAVLEGVALHGRWLHECVEKFAGRRLEPIRVIGGGARSDLWCQIHADVLDRPIERVADPASAILRGAGLFAAASLGLTDAAKGVEIDATFEPDPANRDLYDGLFREFPRLHKAQRRLRRLSRAA